MIAAAWGSDFGVFKADAQRAAQMFGRLRFKSGGEIQAASREKQRMVSLGDYFGRRTLSKSAFD